MPRVTKYEVSETQIADLQAAYDKLLVAEDIAAKEREAGEPSIEREASLKELRDRLMRRAAAYDIPLED